MELTRVERLMLANQFKILEGLFPNEAQSFAEKRVAVENGYAGHYENITRYVNVNERTLSVQQCTEVVDILQMFDQLRNSFNQLNDKTGITPNSIKFPGFDLNNEDTLFDYVKYYCNHDGGRYEGLQAAGVNSHAPMLDTYQRMLAEYRRLTQGRHELLTNEQIQSVIQAR